MSAKLAQALASVDESSNDQVKKIQLFNNSVEKQHRVSDLNDRIDRKNYGDILTRTTKFGPIITFLMFWIIFIMHLMHLYSLDQCAWGPQLLSACSHRPPYKSMKQNFSTDVQQFDDFCHSQKSITCLDNLIQTSSISDYDLGGEGDLFKAPEPIIEQPLISLDPMTSAIAMITCGEDTISPQELKVTDIESLQNEEFLNDVFYECKNILAQEAAAAATESSPLSEVLSFSFPVVTTDENRVAKENVHPSCQIPKSMSADSLNSMDWIQGAQIKPSFLNFSELDFGNAYGMRRAFSDGDIKTLADANTNTGLIQYPLGLGQQQQPPLISERAIEDRMQKLSRYRNKKTKRNFGRKIKYACRKALADSQPRIRGRFAKTDESEMLLRK
ncbi:unnamed protein product [Lactuca saligna]|uniref:CCT domain-containing protein n=1 Tax=Lactuca saligna TaxID=75948 RepID=A0AA35YHR7_LACSI|nr:unnamed protein product [Lactuca saligna]